MTTFSFNKFKSMLPFGSDIKKNGNSIDKLNPEVGFKLILRPEVDDTAQSSKNDGKIPELVVHLIGARHLPSSFGLKSVKGYAIKVKVFPGSVRYESTIQFSSWPKFNEDFKFKMGPTLKSSFKSKVKHSSLIQSLPEKLFKGHFVVLTVFALLELPPGTAPSFREKLNELKKKGSAILKEKEKNSSDEIKKDDGVVQYRRQVSLTTSESRRNIGSVTCFLEPKIFTENIKHGSFYTEDTWMDLKDITTTPARNSGVSTVPQVEIILENATNEPDTIIEDEPMNNASSITRERPKSSLERKDSNLVRRSWRNLNDFRRRLSSHKLPKDHHPFCFKITVSKMRCSIKVKEELEDVSNEYYLKTKVFEHEILSQTWKSDIFYPTLSTRWNPNNSTIVIPMVNDDSYDNIRIEVSLATKTKVGRKIVIGSVMIGPNMTGVQQEHWINMLTNRDKPVPVWYNLENHDMINAQDDVD